MVNNISSTADALIAVALAGSIFVSVPLHAARGRTALGLLCTMLPFAVVAPLTGPLADRVRRGKGFVVLMAAAGRVAAVVMMGLWIHSLLLFPAAFVALVCSKTHAVARVAMVPTVVDSQTQLVSANAKMAVGGGVSSALGAGLGGAVYAVLGSKAVLDLDILVLSVLTILAAELMAPKAAAPVPGRATLPGKRSRLPSAVRRAALAVGGMRAAAGFATALVAFGFRAQEAPIIWYGLVAGGGVAGNLGGAAIAPFARYHIRSNRLLVAVATLLTGATAAIATQSPGTGHRLGALVFALVAGFAGSVAKTAFDATVQSQVPDPARAGAFARLEAMFQTGWVLAALVPTAVNMSLTTGFVVMAVVLLVLPFNLLDPGSRSSTPVSSKPR